MQIRIRESAHGGYVVEVGKTLETQENPIGIGYIMPAFIVYKSSHHNTLKEAKEEAKKAMQKGGDSMKYVIVDMTKTDLFTKEFDTEEEAVKNADRDFERLTSSDKRNRVAFYILKSENADEAAENHLDGDIIKDYFKGE